MTSSFSLSLIRIRNSSWTGTIAEGGLRTAATASRASGRAAEAAVAAPGLTKGAGGQPAAAAAAATISPINGDASNYPNHSNLTMTT